MVFFVFFNLILLCLFSMTVIYNFNSTLCCYQNHFSVTSTQSKNSANDLQKIQNEIINLKSEIVNMKQDIKLQYAKINVSLDKNFKLLGGVNALPDQIIQQPPALTEDLLETFNFPLSSCDEIQKLDDKIRKNSEFKSQMIIALSKIGGTSRNEDGGKVAYKVIDHLFEPNVLINYTWTGVSRGNNPKKSFRILEGILDVFFEVISLADSRHTKQKNCNIFKEGVLKHAMKRSLRKRVIKPGKHSSEEFSDNTIDPFEEHPDFVNTYVEKAAAEADEENSEG